MRGTVQKAHATTQKFTEIVDIVDDVVLLSGNQACLVMEITATNFTLQSKEEQESKILSYASLLNSLSFPIQIVIISRKLDIGSYIRLLEGQINQTQNQALASQIRLYKDFVANLVKVNTVLDKKFYIVLSYSYLEKGAAGVVEEKNKQTFVMDAKRELHSKASSVVQELLRIGLKSRILGKNELIELYYEIYNGEKSRGDHTSNVGVFATGGK